MYNYYTYLNNTNANVWFFLIRLGNQYGQLRLITRRYTDKVERICYYINWLEGFNEFITKPCQKQDLII